MENVTDDVIEEEIRALMRDRGLDRLDAETIVGLKYGELHGDNDILFLRPLTEEERRRFGLGKTIDEVLAEQAARSAEHSTGVKPTPPEAVRPASEAAD